VEHGEEINPRKLAICISHSRGDVGDKVLIINEPARPEDVEDIEDGVVRVLRSRVRGCYGRRGS
jgi:hypothetical protein